MWLLAKLQQDGEIGINAMRSLYLHESGIPGKPTLLGCMRTPARVVLSSHAWRKLSSKEQETHWLGSLLVRRGRLVPVWKAFPYLLCGDSAWEINTEAAETEGVVVHHCPDDDEGSGRCFCERPAFSKYGRGGAAGGLWWIRTTSRGVIFKHTT